MTAPIFILGSASPARRSVLRAAGVEPVVVVSRVDEEAILAALGTPSHAEAVTALAVAKARDVAASVRADGVRADGVRADGADAVLVGCDSMLSIGGELVGKPHTVEVARRRWAAMAGRTGELLTGHCALRLRDGEIVGEATGTCATTVRFGSPAPAELEAYLASGEPLAVAGAFTLDGLGGWFIEGIDGDPSSVIGISLPLTRRLLAELGVAATDLWQRPVRRAAPATAPSQDAPPVR